VNGRICDACGRRLNEEEHRVDGKLVAQTVSGLRTVRLWGCKVRLVGRTAAGNIFTPHTADRDAELDIRYVHEDRLKPGGDLYA
jgi:hypothetical protein